MNLAAVTRYSTGQAPRVQRWILQKVQGAAAECRSAERRTCSNGCTLSDFQILMNSAAVTRYLTGQAPRVQRWILQKVQGAAAEYRGAELGMWSHGCTLYDFQILMN